MASRFGGAFWCHALCPVLLRTCEYHLILILAYTSVEVQINGTPEREKSGMCVVIPTDASVSPLQQKSRRGKVFGRVNCKNIKQDCPNLDCDDPILLPGHCCRTCHKGKHLLTHSQRWLVSKN